MLISDMAYEIGSLCCSLIQSHFRTTYVLIIKRVNRYNFDTHKFICLYSHKNKSEHFHKSCPSLSPVSRFKLAALNWVGGGVASRSG